MSKHFPGVTGAAAVSTRSLQMVRIQVDRAVEFGGVAVIDGEVGSGKTFAARTIHDDLVEAGTRCVWTLMTKGASRGEVLSEVYRKVSGRRVKRGTLLNDVTDDIVELAVAEPVVAFVDEAHLLRAEGLQTLRTLQDRANSEGERALTLVLIGSDLAETLRLATELDDRGDCRETCGRLSNRELIAALHAWHPFWARTDVAVLRDLDDRYCGGRWRAWAKLLAAALRYDEKAQRGLLLRSDIPAVIRLASAREGTAA